VDCGREGEIEFGAVDLTGILARPKEEAGIKASTTGKKEENGSYLKNNKLG
jgi:hypothetical protein